MKNDPLDRAMMIRLASEMNRVYHTRLSSIRLVFDRIAQTNLLLLLERGKRYLYLVTFLKQA